MVEGEIVLRGGGSCSGGGESEGGWRWGRGGRSVGGGGREWETLEVIVEVSGGEIERIECRGAGMSVARVAGNGWMVSVCG